ncbi:MAG: enoyl-CoA hydratase/isomerase family protein [Saccharospirillum sp.]|nr:enoyl-CoA hydratase/isomerase family protein [Saccharospirillum sp.]
MTDTSTPPVLISERRGALQLLRLNRPRALNALNLELIEALRHAVEQALEDDSIQTLWLESTEQKAFCAGGDIKAVAAALANKTADQQRQEGYRYFLAEYHLDALLANCPKPLVVWAPGLVMGGGWGLFAGGHKRLLSPTSLMAMPELSIGLFPDVGAAHFLQQPDWRLGTLIGISGIRLSAPEAVALGYADALIEDEASIETLKHHLAEGQALSEWQAPPLEQKEDIQNTWNTALNSLPEANLADWMQHIQQHDFAPFQQAADHWKTGSMLSVTLTWHHFRKLRNATRVQVLEQDLIVGAHACSEREFAEGVRALLIDKDKNPQWLYPTIESVPFNLIERFYRPLPFETEAVWPSELKDHV